MKSDHQIEYRDVKIHFFWLEDRWWVAAPDLWKALGYSHSSSDPTKLLPVMDKKLNIYEHRKLISGPRKIWIYDLDGFEFAFWPRLRLYSKRKAEMKPLVLAVLSRKAMDGC
jgi:hypothetical protein